MINIPQVDGCKYPSEENKSKEANNNLITEDESLGLEHFTTV